MKKEIIILLFLFAGVASAHSQPAGTIMAFGGTEENLRSLEAQGWTVCDGSLYDRTNAKYRKLFAAIGTSWGGDGANKFAVPDLRGLFLRGISGKADVDPEAQNREVSRTDLNSSGNKGNMVGSKQQDQVKPHTHPITDPGHSHTYAKGGSTIDTWGSRPLATGQLACQHCNDKLVTDSQKTGITQADQNTGAESRPKNAYVYYIIKL